MRLGAFVSAACLLAACALVLPVIATGQTRSYLGRNYTPPDTVIQPPPTDGWRNYVTVPDGPCGYPMSVEADCYNTCRPCGPLHPICFLHRVGRMLDCLLPCNMCCRGGGGGCGLFHGCILGGGRTWGHCGVCCGGGAGAGGAGGCGGGCGGCGCATNPCGSAFAPMPSCTSGGHCFGCGSAIPTLNNPFQDDPLPPTPIPTSQSGTEVRRAPAKKVQPQTAQMRTAPAKPQQPAAPQQRSPYKIVSDPTVRPTASQAANRTSTAGGDAASSHSRKSSSQSVLRRASAEQESSEPAQFQIDRSGAAPIIRSQSPDEGYDYPVPHNPLRR